jgi:hypothetical protein
MRMTWGSTITAGITASVAVVVFLILIPQLIGMGAVDITKELGNAFSTQSPHVAGGIFLALMGIVWATLFSAVYNTLPGTYLTKGMLFGLIVGLFSLAVLPNIMTTLNGMFGAQGAYTAAQFVFNAQAMVTIIAYMVFGLTLAWNYRPAEA